MPGVSVPLQATYGTSSETCGVENGGEGDQFSDTILRIASVGEIVQWLRPEPVREIEDNGIQQV